MISTFLQSIEQELLQNPEDRHQELIEKIAEWIVSENKSGKKAHLNFICTHNSRRSQFAQTWCALVQSHFKMDVVESYSGGTEVTACNERTIAALKRVGCRVESTEKENPVYTITDPETDTQIKLWSKVFDDESNPKGRFAAIMTCDHADANCPFIPGAAIRIPLTYTDPKYADDTPEENEAYDTTCKIIATDMIRLFTTIQKMMA